MGNLIEYLLQAKQAHSQINLSHTIAISLLLLKQTSQTICQSLTSKLLCRTTTLLPVSTTARCSMSRAPSSSLTTSSSPNTPKSSTLDSETVRCARAKSSKSPASAPSYRFSKVLPTLIT